MKKALIEIQNYSFGIGKKEILKDLSFSVFEGEYLSVIGPNGAGKTTLLKCLNGILSGGKGIIKINGKPLGGYKQRDLAKLMSYVPQADGRVFPSFTVYEFVMMGRYPHLSPFSSISDKDNETVYEALVITGTEEFSDRLLSTLSGGERQKVFISAAFAQGARIILLDEPTTFLDPKHQDDIKRILSEINRESGITIVSVTHDINNAVLSSKQILALKNGSVVFHGPAGKIMVNEILERIYEKTFLFAKHPHTECPVIIPEKLHHE